MLEPLSYNTVKAHSLWLLAGIALLFDQPSPLPIPASQVGSTDVGEDSDERK